MKSKFTIDSYEEYLLFLYIYLANSDYSIHHVEISTIISKMEHLFPEVSDLEDLFIEVKDKFETLDVSEMDNVIKENFIKYKSRLQNPERFFNDLFDIIVSDGIIQDYEMEAFDRIKILLSE